jgi:hypothetical protein
MTVTITYRDPDEVAGVAVAIALVVFGFCERRAGKQIGALNQKIVASASASEVDEVASPKPTRPPA